MPDHRRGEPDTRYVRCDPQTSHIVKLVTDEAGVVAITTDAERRVADAWGLAETRLPKLGPREVRELQSKEAKP